MPILPDGYILDSHVKVTQPKDARNSATATFALQLGQVVAIHPVGTPRNWSSRFVEYDVIVFEEYSNIVLYRNCKAAETFGDNVNFFETVLQNTTTHSLDKAYQVDADIQNGAMVLVACLNGHKNQGVIIGCVQHPSWNRRQATSPVPEFNGAGTSSARDIDMKQLSTLLPGARAEDGHRLLGEFNGFRWHINKDGEFTVMCQGVKDASGNLTNSNGGTILKFDKSGRCTIIDRADQVVQIDPDSQKITIADGNAQPDQIVISGQDKTITIKSTSKVVLQDGLGTVNVGSANAIEPLVLGNQFQLHLTQLYTALNTYAGSIAAIADPSGTATSTLATQLATLTAQIQLLLSRKAFTELGP